MRWRTGAVLTLTFEGIPQSETYLLLEGIQAEAVSTLEFYMESPTAEIFAEEWEEMSDYEKRTIREDDYYYTDPSSYDFTCESNVKETEFTYYTALTESSYDRSDYLLNLGYSESGQTQITVALSRRGVYSFENLEVVCMPTGSLAGRLEAPSGGCAGKCILWDQQRLGNHFIGRGQAAVCVPAVLPRLDRLCGRRTFRDTSGKYHVYGFGAGSGRAYDRI